MLHFLLFSLIIIPLSTRPVTAFRPRRPPDVRAPPARRHVSGRRSEGTRGRKVQLIEAIFANKSPHPLAAICCADCSLVTAGRGGKVLSPALAKPCAAMTTAFVFEAMVSPRGPQASSKWATHTLKDHPVAIKIDRAITASPVGGKWERSVASRKNPRYLRPEATGQKLASQFLEIWSFGPAGANCEIGSTERAASATFFIA